MMHDWEEKLCDAEFKRNHPRKDYVVCATNDDGGLYPIAVFSDPELAAGYINRQNEMLKSLAKTLPWFNKVLQFRLLDFVVDSNVYVMSREEAELEAYNCLIEKGCEACGLPLTEYDKAGMLLKHEECY